MGGGRGACGGGNGGGSGGGIGGGEGGRAGASSAKHLRQLNRQSLANGSTLQFSSFCMTVPTFCAQ